MKRIGFIGVGIMGKSMVRNLMKAGYEVSIYARSKAKVEDVIAEGAIFFDSIAECVRNQETIITIVGYPTDVEEVYFGEEGILKNADQGAFVIDMTTSSPKLAEKIYQEAKKKEMSSLDAPVTGGDTGAKNGSLSILVGGDKKAYEKCLPIFEAMGSNINYQGPAGFGQHAKLANQIMIAGTLSGLCEAMAYAQKKGLDVQTVLDSVSTGAAGSNQLNALAPRILKEDFDPGFFIKHFIKDMDLATQESKDVSLDLKVLKQALEMFQKLESQGKGDLGTQALIQYYI